MGFFENLFNRKATDGIPGVSMRESLVWILDKPGATIHDDEKYRINIDFVHSLGLKCDCVGWSELDLADPRADEILDKIKEFCDKNGWRARGVYSREYYGYQSDWFELITSDFRDKTLNGRVNCECDGGGVTEVFNLRACNELRISPKQWSDLIFVPERFRDACIHSGITDVDFCWAEDKGKYRAEQYFHMYSDKTVGCVGTDREIGNKKTKLYRSAGGYLPRISEIFHEIQQVNLQDCYLRGGMPEGGIVHCFLPDTLSFVGRSVFLIYKSTAELLLRENAITEKDLRPALVVDEIPGGYTAERGGGNATAERHLLKKQHCGLRKLCKDPKARARGKRKRGVEAFQGG